MQNTTNSGASKASDFQPLTSNPQQAPGQVFPEQDTVQQSAQTTLLQNNTARISVPVNPAPAPRTVTEAKNGSGTFIVLVVIFLLVAVGVQLWRKRSVSSADQAVAPDVHTEPVIAKTPKTSVNPKKKAVKKAAKKRKRTRK